MPRQWEDESQRPSVTPPVPLTVVIMGNKALGDFAAYALRLEGHNARTPGDGDTPQATGGPDPDAIWVIETPDEQSIPAAGEARTRVTEAIIQALGKGACLILTGTPPFTNDEIAAMYIVAGTQPRAPQTISLPLHQDEIGEPIRLAIANDQEHNTAPVVE